MGVPPWKTQNNRAGNDDEEDQTFHDGVTNLLDRLPDLGLTSHQNEAEARNLDGGNDYRKNSNKLSAGEQDWRRIRRLHRLVYC